MSDISGVILDNNTLNSTIGSNNVSLDTTIVTSNNISSNITTPELSFSLQNSGERLLNTSLSTNAELNSELNIPSITLSNRFFVKYSNDYPQSDQDMMDEPTENTKYIGVSTVLSVSAPTSKDDYDWVKIKGDTGEKGDVGSTGAVGEKGEDGTAYITVLSGITFKDTLSKDNWIRAIRENSNVFYYKQDVNLNEILIEGVSEEQWISKLGQITDSSNTSLLIDVNVDDNIEEGRKQIKHWQRISRAYVIKVTDEEEDTYYLRFECYDNYPNVNLPFVVRMV